MAAQLKIIGPQVAVVGQPADFAVLTRVPGEVSWAVDGGATSSRGTTTRLTFLRSGVAQVYAGVGSAVAAMRVMVIPEMSGVVPMVAETVYAGLTTKEMRPDGAWGANAAGAKVFLDQQKAGGPLVIAGRLHERADWVEAGMKVIDWGFGKQQPDGSFTSEDQFHATSYFLKAVIDADLWGYADQIARARRWMLQEAVLQRGLNNNRPYTHRLFLVAVALGDGPTARGLLSAALARQKPDGVFPEADGYDSSYQGFGITCAQAWMRAAPDCLLKSDVRAAVDRGLDWLESRILPTGEVSLEGNTRVGVEVGQTGEKKQMDWRSAVAAFAQAGRIAPAQLIANKSFKAW